MLALHLLQSSLVFINTQLLHAVLRDPAWTVKLTDEDRRALSRLFWAHANPYGRFRLDMDSRLDLGIAARELPLISLTAVEAPALHGPTVSRDQAIATPVR